VRLSAISLSSRISELLDHARRGSIIAAFPHSCYIALDRDIIAVVGAELLNGPLNLVVSLPEGSTLSDIPVGTAVEARRRTLHVGEEWHIDAASAELWNPRLTPLAGAPDLDRHLASIQELLDAEAPRESLARAEGRSHRAAGAIAQLAAALRTGEIAQAGGAAYHLAGLGPGLTPSGDDLLAGTLLAVAVLEPQQARGFREHIMASVRGRTTRISEAYLLAAADGEAGEAWHRLLALLRRGTAAGGETADLRNAVLRILAFGETSGADMLAGFILAMTALPRG